jgi:thiol-disulfide isomerase/thioredoxin
MNPFSSWLVALGLLLPACSSNQPTADTRPLARLESSILQNPLLDLAGQPVVLADELKPGQKLALVFWQSWCGSCRAEVPALAAAAKKYSQMQFIGVVSGPDEDVDFAAVERAVSDWGVPYRNVRDRSLELTRALKVAGTPTIVVLDGQGTVLYNGHDLPDWDALP